MIGFAGLSHLGIVSSAAVASKGMDVVAFDDNIELVEQLDKDEVPFYEPNLSEVLECNSRRIQFSSNPEDLRNCEITVISRDVATDNRHNSDVQSLREFILGILTYVKPNSTIVILSQIPPGFTREILDSIDEKNIQIYYQVETLIFGDAIHRATNPERIIVGCDDPNLPLPATYEKLLQTFECPIITMKYESAELAKISINMFLASTLSTTNTLAEICESISADWNEIIPSLKLDRRIGEYAYLKPGLGIGGGNIQRDISTLIGVAEEHGTDTSVLRAWQSNSEYRLDWTLRQIYKYLPDNIKDLRIGIWGLAYKEKTSSTKGSPGLNLIFSLSEFQLSVYDPEAIIPISQQRYSKQVSSALEACNNSDLLAIMTPWQEFSSVDLAEVKNIMKGNIILDPFNLVEHAKCVELGILHFSLGSSQ